MAKRVRISADGGTTWNTLPGNTADFKNEAGDIVDTVFGQEYKSGQTGLLTGSMTANSLYKGFAGYVAKIKKAGTSTVLTTEAMSLVAGKTYQVTSAAKRTFNRGVALTFFDNAIAVSAANILNVDYLYGRVTFVAGYTVTGPITVTGAYFPLAQIAKGRTFKLTQTADAVDNTDFETAQANSGIKTFDYGLKTVALEIGGVFALSNAYRALVLARQEAIIEINPDGNDKSVARGFFKPMATNQSGAVGALEEQTINWTLSVPDLDVLAYPFSWLHASDTTLNTAVLNALVSWQNKSIYKWQYLFDGTNGFQFDGVLTDVSMEGGLEAMNSFTVNVQASGGVTSIP